MKLYVVEQIHDTHNVAGNAFNKTKMRHLQTGRLVTWVSRPKRTCMISETRIKSCHKLTWPWKRWWKNEDKIGVFFLFSFFFSFFSFCTFPLGSKDVIWLTLLLGITPEILGWVISVWWELWPETEWGCRVKRIKTLIAISTERIQKFKVKELGSRIGRHYLRKQTLRFNVEKTDKRQEVKCLA